MNNNFNDMKKENTSYIELNSIAKKHINRNLLNTLGISYEDFIQLDFDKQQAILKLYHKKPYKNKGNNTLISVNTFYYSDAIVLSV